MVKVEVQEDYVMQRVIRQEGARLVDLVDDPDILATVWTILTAGTSPAVPVDIGFSLKEVFLTAQPYRLAYEAWQALADHLEPPKPPSAELQRLAARLDEFFGVKPAAARTIRG